MPAELLRLAGGALRDYDVHERRWNLFFTCLAAAVGMFAAALLTGSFWALAGMSVATIGFYGMKTSFWPLPSTFLTGTAAAAAIAGINSIGNLGGLIGPLAARWLKDTTGRFEAGLVCRSVLPLAP